MSCPLAMDAGAYVLGTLSATDRSAFEKHLSGCVPCRSTVSDFADLPDLLSKVDLDAIDGAPTPAPPAQPPLQNLLSAAASRKKSDARRKRRDILGALVTAVVLASIVGIGVHLAERPPTTPTPPNVELLAMHPVAAKAPVSAKVGAYSTAGGTRIVMTCKYASAPSETWVLRLVIFAKTNSKGDQIATWTAKAGQELTLEATTHLTIAQIGRIEVHRADGTAVLTWKSA